MSVAPHSVETSYRFERETADPSIVFDLALPPNATVRRVGEVLEVYDHDDGVVARMSPPSYKDAKGVQRPASFAIEGCHVDLDTRAPWGRAMQTAATRACKLTLRWSRSAEYPVVVDPLWSDGAEMAEARSAHTATRLADAPNQAVLACGGKGLGGQVLATCELYDPKTHTWASTGSMATARAFHTAHAHSAVDGALVIGGESSSGAIASVERYVTATGSWGAYASLNQPRARHASTYVDRYRIVVGGGDASGGVLGSTESLNTFQAGATWGLDAAAFTSPRTELGLVQTEAGLVAIGGRSGTAWSTRLASLEIKPPNGADWSVHPGTLHEARFGAAVVPLPDGFVVAGGVGPYGSSYAADRFVKVSGSPPTLIPLPDLSTYRSYPTAARTSFGSLVVVGGNTCALGPCMSTADALDTVSDTWSDAGTLVGEQTARARATATLLQDGRVLVAGGEVPATGDPTPTTYLYREGGCEFDSFADTVMGRVDPEQTTVIDLSGEGSTDWITWIEEGTIRKAFSPFLPPANFQAITDYERLHPTDTIEQGPTSNTFVYTGGTPASAGSHPAGHRISGSAGHGFRLRFTSEAAWRRARLHVATSSKARITAYFQGAAPGAPACGREAWNFSGETVATLTYAARPTSAASAPTPLIVDIELTKVGTVTLSAASLEYDDPGHIYVETDMSVDRGIDPATGTRVYQTFRDNPQLSSNVALESVYSADAGAMLAEGITVTSGATVVTHHRSTFHYKVYEEPYAATDPAILGGSIQSEPPSPLDPDGGNPAFRYGPGTGEISRYGTALDRLLATPLFDGSWTAPQTVGVFGRGLRVGHRPATVRLYAVQPDGTEVPEGDPITVMLHPSVLLVPVEVGTLYSSGDALGGFSQRLDWALEQLDQRVVDAPQSIYYAGEHVRTTTLRKSQLTGPERGWLYQSRGSATIDSIWARCGVQFRLVNYVEQERPHAEVTNSGLADLVPYCSGLGRTVADIPRHMSEILRLTRAVSLGDVGSSSAGDGVAPVGSSLVCIGKRTQHVQTLGHEVGHSVGLQHCTSGPTCNLMMDASPGFVPTESDCITMRSYAQTSSDRYATKFPSRWP